MTSYRIGNWQFEAKTDDAAIAYAEARRKSGRLERYAPVAHEPRLKGDDAPDPMSTRSYARLEPAWQFVCWV